MIGFQGVKVQEDWAIARIVIDGFSETFHVDLRYWSAVDYVGSWRAALEVLENAQISSSCLVSSITDPSQSNFFSCWPMYRIGEDVFVQNAVVFFDQLNAPFDPKAPWRSVLPRDAEDDQGNRISEWKTTMRAIRIAAAQLEDHSV